MYYSWCEKLILTQCDELILFFGDVCRGCECWLISTVETQLYYYYIIASGVNQYLWGPGRGVWGHDFTVRGHGEHVKSKWNKQK